MIALLCLIFQHNSFYIASFFNSADVILSSVFFFALYGLCATIVNSQQLISIFREEAFKIYFSSTCIYRWSFPI